MTEPFDTADVDALQELIYSRGWKLLEMRLRTELERKREDLEMDSDLQKTSLARGRVDSLRLALRLPIQLRDEIAAEIQYKP